MLWFVGLGISGPDSLPIKAQKVLSKADIVYLERFTNPMSESDIKKIKSMLTGQLKEAKRWFVEDGSEILNNSKRNKVVLLSYGDPFVATTHIELRTRAIQNKIKTLTIHASSSLTSVVGECGLHHYKVRGVVTAMKDTKTLTTPYYLIYKNLVDGKHTVILLEYDHDSKFFLSPNTALDNLLELEKEQKRNVIVLSLFAIVASRVGSKNQAIIAGKVSNLKKIDFGKPPHTIIIPGLLHFTEVDALKVLARCIDEPFDNSDKLSKISKKMIEKYVPMVKQALNEVLSYYKDDKNFQPILENAELYIKDAEKFLEQGKDEVAILSIGYADGLVDALRMAKGLEPKM